MLGLPDFSGLAETGEAVTKQFAAIVSLLQKMSDDIAVIRQHVEGKPDEHNRHINS